MSPRWSRRFMVMLALVAGCEGSTPVGEGPARLSETGLYADLGARRLAAELIELTPRFPLWSDGADKRRFLRLPPGTRIDTSDPDAWRFPIGTRLWKEFRLDGVLIETRLLEKRRDPDEGGWFQMAYAWREDGSDADAVPDGVSGAQGLPYDIPSQRNCGSCHYLGEKPVIGISSVQLSVAGPDGRAPIDVLEAAGLLSDPPARRFQAPGEPIVAEALGYLHGNCAHCHDSRSAAAKDVKVFMELHTDDAVPEQTRAYLSLVDRPPNHFPEVGVTALVEPGDPEHSLVHYRMARRDPAQMPPLGTRAVDQDGLGIIDAWITSLPVAP